MPDYNEEEIERYRFAAAAAIAHTGLRTVAQEVGMSPSALGDVVSGSAKPYPKTVQKLRTWFAARHGEVAMQPAEILALLRALSITAPRPDEVIARFLDDLEREHRAGAIPTPRWIDGAREMLRTP